MSTPAIITACPRYSHPQARTPLLSRTFDLPLDLILPLRLPTQAMQLSQDPALLWVIIIASVAAFLSIALYIICVCCSEASNQTGDSTPEDEGWYGGSCDDSAHAQQPPPYSTIWAQPDPHIAWTADRVTAQGSTGVRTSDTEFNLATTKHDAGLPTTAMWLQAHCLSPLPPVVTRYRSMDILLLESRQEGNSMV